MFTRTRYQYGSLRLKKRQKGPDVWEFRYYDYDSDGHKIRKYITIGSKHKYSTESDARTKVQSLLLRLNAEAPQAEWEVPDFGVLLDKFIEEEMPSRYSTAAAYRSVIKNHLRPKWGDYPLDRFSPIAIEQWFRQLKLAPKSKGNIRSLMHLIFTCAERWCLIEMGKNPISLARDKDCTKRLKRPRILTVEQFLRVRAVSQRSSSHDGDRGPVFGASSQRNCGTQMGRLRFRRVHAAGAEKRGPWEG